MFVLLFAVMRDLDSWESGRNPLMQNASIRHQLGKNVCKIKCEPWTHAPQQTIPLFDQLVGRDQE